MYGDGCTRRWRDHLAEARGGAGAGFSSFGFSVAMGRGGFKGGEQPGRNAGDFVNGGVESGFVGFGGMMHAGDFADELERSGADLFGRDWGIEVEKWSDVAAHLESSPVSRPVLKSSAISINENAVVPGRPLARG